MNNLKIIYIVVVAIIGSTLCVHARGGLELHSGLAIPCGEFSYYYSGYPLVGSNFGAKYYHQFKNSGISLLCGTDIFSNEASLSSYSGEFDDGTLYKSTMCGIYFNMPLMTGLNYQYPISKKISIFGEANIGFNVSFVPDEKINYHENSKQYSYTIISESSSDFCFNLGAGILYKRVSLTYNWYWLGKQSYKYIYEDNSFYYWNTNVGEMSVTLGLRLFKNKSVSPKKEVSKKRAAPQQKNNSHDSSKHGGRK